MLWAPTSDSTRLTVKQIGEKREKRRGVWGYLWRA
jgi:hypothetical protein